MASWMVHLRIADNLLSQIPNLSETEFIVGNIAPDSGIPNEDWTSFTPSAAISHYRRDSGEKVGKKIDLSAYIRQYFTPEQQKAYSGGQYAFYLGYLTHLLTDILWADKIALPAFRKHIGENASVKDPLVPKIKDDWYDLDFLFLREHPDFHAFAVYESAVGFENTYMTEFSPDAFDNRRVYITSFYRKPNGHLDREYPYLTKGEMDAFVENSTEEIIRILKNDYGVTTGRLEVAGV